MQPVSQQTLTRQQVGAEFVKILRRYVGVREDPLGSNSGKAVQAIQAATTLAKSDPTGWPWCAALLAAAQKELWTTLAIELPPIWNFTASCDVLLGWARQRDILFAEPEQYDAFLSMRTPNDAVHTGEITAVTTRGRLETIEGNTNKDHSREGIGVFEFTGADARDASNKKFIRWLHLLPESIPCGGRFRGTAGRLILVLPPYAPSDYHYVSSATFAADTWTVDIGELRPVVPSTAATTGLRGVVSLRDAIGKLGFAIDETRTRLGNHMGDDNDPRQYVFLVPPVIAFPSSK